jgi:transcriptional regulator with XRE-family HTH domain
MEASALRERRYQMGLSQAELAKRLGYSARVLGEMERGRKPSAFFLQCWREALGVKE